MAIDLFGSFNNYAQRVLHNEDGTMSPVPATLGQQADIQFVKFDQAATPAPAVVNTSKLEI